MATTLGDGSDLALVRRYVEDMPRELATRARNPSAGNAAVELGTLSDDAVRVRAFITFAWDRVIKKGNKTLENERGAKAFVQVGRGRPRGRRRLCHYITSRGGGGGARGGRLTRGRKHTPQLALNHDVGCPSRVIGDGRAHDFFDSCPVSTQRRSDHHDDVRPVAAQTCRHDDGAASPIRRSQVGRTTTFVKKPMYDALEQLRRVRAIETSDAATIVQSAGRRTLARGAFLRTRAAARVMAPFCRMAIVLAPQMRKRKAAKTLQSQARASAARAKARTRADAGRRVRAWGKLRATLAFWRAWRVEIRPWARRGVTPGAVVLGLIEAYVGRNVLVFVAPSFVSVLILLVFLWLAAPCLSLGRAARPLVCLARPSLFGSPVCQVRELESESSTRLPSPDVMYTCPPGSRNGKP